LGASLLHAQAIDASALKIMAVAVRPTRIGSNVAAAGT
jgi:hypothetical protein